MNYLKKNRSIIIALIVILLAAGGPWRTPALILHGLNICTR